MDASCADRKSASLRVASWGSSSLSPWLGASFVHMQGAHGEIPADTGLTQKTYLINRKAKLKIWFFSHTKHIQVFNSHIGQVGHLLTGVDGTYFSTRDFY